MKRIFATILVLVLIMALGAYSVMAAPVIVPESEDTPIVEPSAGYSDGGSIVIIDPTTGRPEPTVSPAENTVTYIETAPVLTKNPTDETVDAGSEMVFVARANYATSVTWFLVNGDTAIMASAVGNEFKGMTATGANTERLVLSNVSDQLDGWTAQARFDNEIGNTWSSAAKISVTPDPNAVPSPTPTPLPTATPAVTPTPIPNTNSGTAVQHNTGTTNLTTGSQIGNSDNTSIGNTGTDVGTYQGTVPTVSGTYTSGSGGSARNNHVGAYILAAVAGLVIIGSVLVMALYMQGKISLGKFEKFLGSFGNRNSDSSDSDMFDNDGEFYNPDDFKELQQTQTKTKNKK